MDRRQFAIATAAFGGRLLIDPFSSFRAPAQDGDVLSPAYAEFATPFTYLTATSRDHGLLAVARQPSPFGFAWIGGETFKVKAVTIAPPADRRAFTVELEDGRRLDGETRTIRTISTPIEGQRRPSATIKVTSSIGDMIGHINDWTG
jgi:hypothetical protein